MSKRVKNQNRFTKHCRECGGVKVTGSPSHRLSLSFKCWKSNVCYARYMDFWEWSLDGTIPSRPYQCFCRLVHRKVVKETLQTWVQKECAYSLPRVFPHLTSVLFQKAYTRPILSHPDWVILTIYDAFSSFSLTTVTSPFLKCWTPY